MAICPIPFYPNPANYLGSREHNKNARKFWFLILECGLYTRRSDADALIDAEEVLVFRKLKQAQACWAKHCARYHDQTDLAHQDGLPEPPAPDRSSPMPTSLRVEVPRQRHSRNDGVERAASTPAPAPPSASNPPPARSSTRAMSTPAPASASGSARLRTKAPASREARRKRKSPPLPLFRDDDEPSPPRGRYYGKAPSAVNEGAKSLQPTRVLGIPGAPATLARAYTAAPASPSAATASAPPTHDLTPSPSPARPAAPFHDDLTAAPSPARPAPYAEPPPVYMVDSDSDVSEPSTPARTSPAPADGETLSPSVSSMSSLSSEDASDDLPVGWGPAPASRFFVFPRASFPRTSSPRASSPRASSPRASSPRASSSRAPAPSASYFASRTGLGSPRAAASSVLSASRTGLVPPRAAASSASSASRAGLGSPQAGGSAGAEPVLLFNTGSRLLYKDAAKAVREMKDEDSVEVYEDVVEFLSARAGRKAAESV